MSAISHHALFRGHPPLPRHRTFDRVKAGLSNWYGDSNFSEPAKAITVEDLFAIRARIDTSLFEDARDWCACVFAFFGLLRIKEYMCAGLLTEHVIAQPWGIQLTVPFSKTMLIPATVAIIRRDDELCPHAAYRAYTALLPISSRQAGRPFFLAHAHSNVPLSDTTFIRRVRRWIQQILRQDSGNYSGHSFRRGGTSAMQLAGVPEANIAAHGRWKSLAYRSDFDVQHSVHLRLVATAQLRLMSRHRPNASSSV